MAEYEPQIHSPEKQQGVENSAEQKEKLQHLLDKAQDAKHEYKESEEQLHHAAKQEALTAQEIQGKVAEKEKSEPADNSVISHQETKKAAYRKVLNRAQRQLSKPERTFSKVVHQPVIDRLSEVGSKTIARPSGILAGGFFALLGSSIVFYMSKHYGFRYNFFVFLLLLGSGFTVGLIIELLWNTAKKVRGH